MEYSIYSLQIIFLTDPYSNEQSRPYEEIVAAASYGETFAAADPFRKTATPATEIRDQRTTQFQQPGAVLMVYGLDPLRTNADKLFNLMCLYGNVARVSNFKPYRVKKNLNNTTTFSCNPP